jgi:hypothetical protein
MLDSLTQKIITAAARLRYEENYLRKEEDRVAWLDTTEGVRRIYEDEVINNLQDLPSQPVNRDFIQYLFTHQEADTWD